MVGVNNMPTNISNFNWGKFWEGMPENSDDIQDIEGIIFRKNNGVWVMVVTIPNSFEVMSIAVDYNPFTGEKLN